MIVHFPFLFFFVPNIALHEIFISSFFSMLRARNIGHDVQITRLPGIHFEYHMNCSCLPAKTRFFYVQYIRYSACACLRVFSPKIDLLYLIWIQNRLVNSPDMQNLWTWMYSRCKKFHRIRRVFLES